MYASDSDSEEEDEDDEDSNGLFMVFLLRCAATHLETWSAEDWYKNDYPEEEESSDGDSDSSGTSRIARQPILVLINTDMFHDETYDDDDDEVYGGAYERMVGNRAHWHA